MTDVEATYEGFLASRRSGRRNAVHEIESAAEEAAKDLSQSLAELNINKSAGDDADTESTQDPPSKEEETQGGGS